LVRHESESTASLPARLAYLSGYSYEHCRKVLSGRLNVSWQFNIRVAAALHLDADALWSLLLEQRLLEDIDTATAAELKATDPAAHDLLLVWQQLGSDDRRALLRLARGLLCLSGHAAPASEA
jgi:hypothetical protein